MSKLRLILNRKKAAQKIRKITRSMAMIASARLQKLWARTLATNAYTQGLREMAAELAARVGDLRHLLLRQSAVGPSARRVGLLVITSNRGLAGAYSSHVLRMASDFVHEREARGEVVELYVSGKKGLSYFTFHHQPVARRIDVADNGPAFAHVQEVSAFLMDRFVSNAVDAVYVAYTEFVSAGTQRPKLLMLFPMTALIAATAAADGKPSASWVQIRSGAQYDFSPGPEVLLAELLPLMLEACLFECFLNAATSENAARRIAMMRATDSADQISKSLALRYNRARQDQITNELLDIIGAAEAIRNR
jgi:F-type H+-transporting ATPase subunit gamma